MTFRSICIAVYVFFYLIFTTPMRARLKKLEKTDPQEASRIAQEQVQKGFKHLLKNIRCYHRGKWTGKYPG